MLFEIAFVVVLTVLNGVLAMSELAVVSSRPARLRVLEERGSKAATTALRLAEDPGRFLSTVQIGITLVGILSGAFSGATLGQRLTDWLELQGMSNGLADALGVGSVVIAITYLSLIVGELVPKQIALRNAEGVAVRMAPAMLLLSYGAMPLVWLLDASGRGLLHLLGQRGEPKEAMTEEEVKTIIAEAETAGVLQSDEKEMISGVMRLADRTARALMTPRGEVEFIDVHGRFEDVLQQARASRRSRLPVKDGGADDIIGVIKVRDLFEAAASGQHVDLRTLVEIAPTVADQSRALDVLRRIRSSPMDMALVFDEYGHFEGVVTAADVLEAITGALHDEADDEPAYVVRSDGSFLVSGWMPVDEFADRIGVPVDRDADYATAAGFVLHAMSRLPEVGEKFTTGGWRIEVMDLDGRRIDKILVSRAEA